MFHLISFMVLAKLYVFNLISFINNFYFFILLVCKQCISNFFNDPGQCVVETGAFKFVYLELYPLLYMSKDYFSVKICFSEFYFSSYSSLLNYRCPRATCLTSLAGTADPLNSFCRQVHIFKDNLTSCSHLLWHVLFADYLIIILLQLFWHFQGQSTIV